MTVLELLETVAISAGGIAVFLFGLKTLSKNVILFLGNKAEYLLNKATRSRTRGVLTGAGITALIQSSTATNVILAEFVNAGVTSFSSTIPVIMGANIGTTVTAQLVALSGAKFPGITAIGSIIFFIGFILSFSKKEKLSVSGNSCMGFGLIFIGLEITSAKISILAKQAFFKKLFTVRNPIYLILNGILITGVLQSSSAVSSVIILLANTGLISFTQSAFFILGTNIGSGAAILLLSSQMNKEAKSVAAANLVFNLLGCVLVLPFMLVFDERISTFFHSLSGSPDKMIADFHTVFNIASTIVLLPFCGIIEKLSSFTLTKNKGIKLSSRKKRFAN